MNEPTLFLITFILYLVSALLYFGYLFTRKDKPANLGLMTAFLGLIIHTAALILRTFESGHAPFTNMYESLSFLAWASVLAFVVIEYKYRIKKAGPYFF